MAPSACVASSLSFLSVCFQTSFWLLMLPHKTVKYLTSSTWPAIILDCTISDSDAKQNSCFETCFCRPILYCRNLLHQSEQQRSQRWQCQDRTAHLEMDLLLRQAPTAKLAQGMPVLSLLCHQHAIKVVATVSEWLREVLLQLIAPPSLCVCHTTVLVAVAWAHLKAGL